MRCTLLILTLLLTRFAEGQEQDIPLDRAGTADVEEIIKTFNGRGQLADGSQPVAASEAVKRFAVPDDLSIELVLAEPQIMQPLFMHFDARGRLWVVEYLQYPFPEGLKVIEYDQHLRAVFDKVPLPPPDHVRGKDRISVFTDSDGDGRYDRKKIVINGLNIATSVVTGGGGIWVLNPPYLLFYPDADGDDIPDGNPEVRLAGFGLEDTHSVTNSLRWGPDGWLYAANGSTTTANISSRTTKNVRWEGQCIWRYHPLTDVFEIYAEGGGNTFSSEIDSRGRVFSGTNHGNTRGMYYPQGSYGSKNWGKHGPLTNPYAFGYFNHMSHSGDRDRFAQTFVIYEGGMLPKRFQGQVIAANALHNRVWASQLLSDGSTYRTIDQPNVCATEDRWFRPVDVKVGPDGAVYVADWYDSRLSHVDPRDDWHKTSGRIYRLQVTTDQQPGSTHNLQDLSSEELLLELQHPNKWHRQTAVRLLSERLRLNQENDADVMVPQLKRLAEGSSAAALEAVWILSQIDQLDEPLAIRLLQHRDADVRRWIVRLLGDKRAISPEIAQVLIDVAESEPYVQVRSQLASTAKRLETQYALPILGALLQRDEDTTDPHLPLLVWWALEAHCGTALAESAHLGVPLATINPTSPRQQVLRWLEEKTLWETPVARSTLTTRLMRRFAMEGIEWRSRGALGRPADAPLTACAKLIQLAPHADAKAQLMAGFLEAFQGQEIGSLPSELKAAVQSYQQSLANSDLVLGLKLGSDDALKKALQAVASSSTDLPIRLSLVETFGEVNTPSAVPVLLKLTSGSESSALKLAALNTLMSYPDEKIGTTICQRYQTSLPNEHGIREMAHRVLASRAVWAKQFLKEIDEYRIDAETVALDIVQQLRQHGDSEIEKLVTKHWGRIRATSAEKQAEMARIRASIRASESADLARGQTLFEKQCGTCHTLFDTGGQTGPNLTGYERSNVSFLTLAIADPSAAIRKEFIQYQIATTDGRVLNGLLEDQTPTTVSIRGANNQVTLLSRDDIDKLKAVEASLMPDNLTTKLSDDELRDLLAYLMGRTPPVLP